MWRFLVWPRRIFPVPVFLKRLAAPLCVFNLGMVFLLTSRVDNCSDYTGERALTPPAPIAWGRALCSGWRCAEKETAEWVPTILFNPCSARVRRRLQTG